MSASLSSPGRTGAIHSPPNSGQNRIFLGEFRRTSDNPNAQAVHLTEDPDVRGDRSGADSFIARERRMAPFLEQTRGLRNVYRHAGLWDTGGRYPGGMSDVFPLQRPV